MTRLATVRVLCALIATAAMGCADERAGEARAVNAQRLNAADADAANWLSHGRTYDEQRFSPLAQIDTSNVARLGLAWYHDLNAAHRGQESTPLVIDGTMYVTSAWSKVFALDARTGALLWEYDPLVPGAKAKDACCDVVNRGLAAWEGKLFVGTLDGRLVALEAGKGTPVWSVMTVDPQARHTITGAPRVVKGKVLIGNGGGDLGVRGYVSAYDATTGRLEWRFYTVPGDPSLPFESTALERAAQTWSGEWWKHGGGGTVWDSMAHDPQLDLLYIGVGNGSPWNQALRSPGGGDNLYLSSVVALRPDDGEYVWHYQTTPGDTWDYTATQHMIDHGQQTYAKQHPTRPRLQARCDGNVAPGAPAAERSCGSSHHRRRRGHHRGWRAALHDVLLELPRRQRRQRRRRARPAIFHGTGAPRLVVQHRHGRRARGRGYGHLQRRAAGGRGRASASVRHIGRSIDALRSPSSVNSGLTKRPGRPSRRGNVGHEYKRNRRSSGAARCRGLYPGLEPIEARA